MTPGCVLSYSWQVIHEGETFPWRQHRMEKLYTRVEFPTLAWIFPERENATLAKGKPMRVGVRPSSFTLWVAVSWSAKAANLLLCEQNEHTLDILMPVFSLPLWPSKVPWQRKALRRQGMCLPWSKALAVPTMLPFNALFNCRRQWVLFSRGVGAQCPPPPTTVCLYL